MNNFLALEENLQTKDQTNAQISKQELKVLLTLNLECKTQSLDNLKLWL